ncbi:MAG: hypothetical protein KJN75_05240, partial [Muriicola sp.]|nr:hypothetical protein [Muriicola sp.]
MKTGAKSILKFTFKLFFLLVIFLGAGHSSWSQETDDQPIDSVKTGAALGKIVLENPESVISKYTYDPQLDRYIYTESVGDYNINYPVILTPAQYLELV